MFYLTLPSNSSKDFYPDNTLTHYFTKLPQAVDLKGEWEVGLVEIQYPHSWYNVQGDDRWVDIKIDGITYRGILRAGYYESPGLLVSRMKLMCDSLLPDCHAVVFSFDDITKKVTVSIKPTSAVTFGPLLQSMLGLKQDHYGPGIHVGDQVVDIRQGFYSLYVYCNVVEPHVVGDVLAPLLRIVPIRGKDDDLVTRTYENVHYHKLQHRFFDALEVDIRSDSGKRIPFERGKVVVTLHFRRRRSPLL